MASRFCQGCKVHLPVKNEFLKCPRCKKGTEWSSAAVMSPEALDEFRRTYEPEKFANEQIVVVYDHPKTGKTLAYDTAYNQDQAQQAVKHAVAKHGTPARVRCVFGSPETLA